MRSLSSARAFGTAAIAVTVALVAASSLSACDPDKDGNRIGPPPPQDTSGGTSTATNTNTAPPPDLVTTHDTHEPPPGTCTTVTIVQGQVTDAFGTALAGARPQSCVRGADGTLVCLRPGETGADGTFAQPIPFENQCVAELTMRTLLPESGLATTYCHATLPSGGNPVLALSEPIVLHPTQPASVLPPEGDPSFARTVVFPSGIELDVAPANLLYSSSLGYESMAAAQVPVNAPGLCFMEPAEPAIGLIAFYPEVDIASSGTQVRIPNTASLPPGAVVTMEVLGGLDCHLLGGELVPEAEWAEFGVGAVSADGSRIVANAVPCLTWMRYRVRQ